MAGVLNYRSHTQVSRRGQMYGVASNCIASVVFGLPILVTLISAVLQRSLSRPGNSAYVNHVTFYMDSLPMMAVVFLPCLGLLLAGLSIGSRKHRHEIAFVGLVVNISALVAGVSFFIQQYSV